MIWPVLALIPVALLIAAPVTLMVRNLSRRAGALDTAGVAGQVKAPTRGVPNTGGIAVFLALTLPILAGAGGAMFVPGATIARWVPAAEVHLAGMRAKAPLAGLLVACLGVLHILGLIDDRRPLGPWLKLAVMALPAIGIVAASDTRLLTFLDARVGGAWLSIALTVLWFLVVTNALNFMDNMDGLSCGVTAIASACFLAATLVQGQWFVGGFLALLVGACVGFLVFNFPWRGQRDTPKAGAAGGASIFLGDGGSLLLGFMLAFLTTRTTYIPSVEAHAGGGEGQVPAGHWYAVFMPLIVLAVPLYDFASVVLIRLRAGRPPFVGDLNHLSHRIVRRGLTRRAAVVVIYLFTAATGLTGISLAALRPWQAALAGAQTILLLLVLAIVEWAHARGGATAHTPTASEHEGGDHP